jgi:uncharacterized protein
MQHRTLGRTGVKVSQLGFGGAGVGLKNYLTTWNPTAEKEVRLVEQAMERAIELGISYFDTAPLYGSEKLFGRVLKPHRDQVFLATKVRETNAADVRRSIEDSLMRLQTDQIDLMQFHGEWYTEEQVHHILKPEGALAGLRAAQEEGLIRFIGFTAEGVNGPLSRLIATGEFDVMQIQYNFIFQHPYDPSKNAGALYEAEKQGMGIALMRAFTGGAFSKWLKLIAPGIELREDYPKLIKGLLSFVLSNPLTDVAIVGMRSASRVEENCSICDDLESRIDPDELFSYFIGP